MHYRRGASAFWLQIGEKPVCETTAGWLFLVTVSKILVANVHKTCYYVGAKYLIANKQTPIVLGVSCVAFVYIQQTQYSTNKRNSQGILLRLFTFVCLHKNGGVILFYLNFVRLCNRIGKSPSAVAEEMGFQRSVVTRWSNGSVPRKATIEKIATFFNVPSEELTGESEQKEKPAPQMENGLDAKAQATLNKMKNLSPEQQAAFWDMLNTTIDAVLNMPDGDGNG